MLLERLPAEAGKFHLGNRFRCNRSGWSADIVLAVEAGWDTRAHTRGTQGNYPDTGGSLTVRRVLRD